MVTLPIVLNSLGDESSISFSFNFNPQVLTNPLVTIGISVPTGSNLEVNTNDAAQGRIGVLVDSTNTFAAGEQTVVTLTFVVAPNAILGQYPVTFGMIPTPQSVSSATGILLPTNYFSGNVVLPTSAGVEVSGRVLTPDGRGLRNAVVTITDMSGNKNTATTGSFGFYSFSQIEAGQTYIVGVNSKRYRFSSRLVTVNDTLIGLDLVGLE